MVASTIKTALQHSVQLLKQSGSPSAILDAELLLLHGYDVHGIAMNKIKLITNCNDIIPENIYHSYIEFVEQRCQGKPVQYITGKQEFMGLELVLSEKVLIPRGDTEIIVEKLLELTDKNSAMRIIDMCTGTGAIAVSLAHFLPQAEVIAVDISEEALECCNRNIQKHGLQNRIKALKSNLFEDLTRSALTNNIDMVVSNPPYIPTEDIAGLAANVKDYEPMLALDGGRDGLDFYRRIIHDAVHCLRSRGILAFEIGYNQGQDIMNMIKESGGYDDLECFKDLAGLDRCVIARKK
ncbi:MAG: hemK [Clostridia bacterium]|nr:hemK [Clostridia bacterium]